jgi:uncharacterized lipoprotein YmbA
MAMQLHRRGFLSLVPPLALAACSSSPDPGLYVIAVRPGTAVSSGPPVVQLRDVTLPSYLDRREIVRSSEDYKIGVRSNDWWAEPLGSMLGRVLSLELSQRLPGSNVYREGGAISLDPNAVLAVNVQRLEVDASRTVQLLAQVAVEFNRPRRTASRNFTIAKPVSATTVVAEVAAISDAVAELADGIAQMMQR